MSEVKKIVVMLMIIEEFDQDLFGFIIIVKCLLIEIVGCKWDDDVYVVVIVVVIGYMIMGLNGKVDDVNYYDVFCVGIV